MRYFLKQIVLFFFISTGSLFLLILLVNSYTRQDKFFIIPENKSLLILGNSQTECAFNDTIIHDAYNLSSGGEAYFYTYFKLQKLLQANDGIKAILLSYSNPVIENVMDEWTWGDMYINARYPKYAQNMDIEGKLLLASKNPATLISSQSLALKRQLAFILNRENYIPGSFAWGGHLHLIRDKTDSLIMAQDPNWQAPQHYELSKTNIEFLGKIVELCKSKNVPLILVRCPVHNRDRGIYNEPDFQKVLSTTGKGASFIDLKDFPLSNSEFGDLNHLNYRGAKIFSAFFQNLLDSGLLNSNEKQVMIERAIRNYRSQVD